MYLAYHKETKDEAQHRIWTFYEAIILVSEYFPHDSWGVDSSLKLFRRENPDMAYILLAQCDDAGHCLGNAWDSSVLSMNLQEEALHVILVGCGGPIDNDDRLPADTARICPVTLSATIALNPLKQKVCDS